MAEFAESLEQLSPSQRALLALKEMRLKLEALERARTEPIAIIGMACRFPGGADHPEAFWRLLREGAEAISEVPPERWDREAYYDADPNAEGKMYTRRGGFLRQIDAFDPQFFGIAPREAERMDPQHLLLLEVCWEALEHAALAPGELSGSQTGVFLGAGNIDHALNQMKNGSFTSIADNAGTGSGSCFAAGRVSYVLGLHGPCIVVDTACSSSLVAVHLACQSLRAGESHVALAGGINLILSPEGTVNMCRGRMLSANGQFKIFDAEADGFVRGEGCGIVVLKRLSGAIADGDNILAVIRGSAVNQDGRSNGLTAPNGLAQEALIRQALANAGVKPAEVSYIDPHGSGTLLGDQIEIKALTAIMSEGRAPDQTLLLSSAKTSFGHLEAASGILSLIKTVLALQHKEIPPHLNLHKINPLLNLNKIPAEIAVAPTPWPATNGRRIAGISSFGMSGTNAHVVVEEAPVIENRLPANSNQPPARSHQPTVNEQPGTDHSSRHDDCPRPWHLLCLSAKTGAALRELAGKYESFLAEHLSQSMGDICYTAGAGRTHFSHRLALVAASPAQAREKLLAFIKENGGADILRGQPQGAARPKIGFVFTGQGREYSGMGRQLYDTQPVFRKTVDECNEILSHLANHGQLSVNGDPLSKSIDYCSPTAAHKHAGHARLALFALQCALAKLWQSWGIAPALLAGDQIGEWAAACFAGMLSLQDAMKLLAAWMRAEEDDDRQEGWASLEKALRETQLHAPHIPVVSGLTGKLLRCEEIADAGYWQRRQQQPARFDAAISWFRDKGCELFLELGPDAMPREQMQNALPDMDAWLPSLKRGQENWQTMLHSLGVLYVRGAAVNWIEFDRPYAHRRIVLPTYSFQREVYYRAPKQAPVCASELGKIEEHAPAILHERPDLPNAYVAPQNETEGAIAEIWQELLGIRQVGTKDNFFELGGNSLLGILMSKKIEKKLGREIPHTALFQAPTIQLLAGIITQVGMEAPSWSALVPIQPHGTRPPFYMVHPGAGTVLGFYELPRYLGADQPFYGLQARGLDGKQKPFGRVEAMAAHYLKEIRALQPNGPYFIGGRCFGGVVALEMAQQLHAAGEKVALLAIIDTMVLHNVDPEEDELEDLEASSEAETEEGGVKKAKRRRTREDFPDFYARILENVARKNLKARKKYIPKPYPGRITLFRNGDAAANPEHQSKWALLAAGGMDIEVVPGEHKTILLEPHVRVLAERLRARMDAAMANGT